MKMREQISAWRVSAVVAVAKPGSRLGRYLTVLLGDARRRHRRRDRLANAVQLALIQSRLAQRRFIGKSRIHNEGRGGLAGTRNRAGQGGW